MATALSDGQLLCQLINTIEGKDKRSFPAKLEERFQYFFEKCRNLGVPDGLQFDPVYDLQWKQNVVKVIYYVHSLAEKCHTTGKAPFFKGSQVERKKQKTEWRAKAKKALDLNQPLFDHWEISPNLLTQLKVNYIFSISVKIDKITFSMSQGLPLLPIHGLKPQLK